MKVKHLINEILKNNNKKRNETLASKLLSYEWSYEQYIRFVFVLVSLVSGIFQLKKLSTLKSIPKQTFVTPSTIHYAFDEDSNIRTSKHDKKHITTEEKENKADAIDANVPNNDTFTIHEMLKQQEYSVKSPSDKYPQYSVDGIVSNPLKNLQECLTEQDSTINVLGGIFSNINYIKTTKTDDTFTAGGVSLHGYSSALVFPYSRYAIIEEQSGPLYAITKPLQFYSNLLPVWMVAELLIGLNSRKRTSYIIRRINCWNNSKRLEDVVGINQISESINTIIYSLNKEKVPFFLPNFVNDAWEHAMRIIGVRVNKPNTSKTCYESHNAQNYLFVGPSGTGKTVLAQALAGSSKVSMFCTTLSELQSSSLTTGPAHLRTLFQKAKIHKPSLIVLENLELIGQIRQESTTYLDIQLFTELLVALTPRNNRNVHSEYSVLSVQSTKIFSLRNIINKAQMVLEALRNPNIYSGITVEPNILIGTTDDIEKLDPALIRPGRFNCVIYFSYPNTKDRVRLLKHFTSGYQSNAPAGLSVPLPFDSNPFGIDTSYIGSSIKKPNKHLDALLYYFARKTMHYTHAHLYVLVNESKLQSIMQFFIFNLPWFVIQNSHFRIKNSKRNDATYLHSSKWYQLVYGQRMNIFIKRYTHKIAKFNKSIFCVIILSAIFAQKTFSFICHIVFNDTTQTYKFTNTRLGEYHFFHLQKGFYDINK